MGAAPELTGLLDTQATRLARLEDHEVRRVLSVLEDSRREVGELIAATDAAGNPWTAARWVSSRAQLDAAIGELRTRLGETLGASVIRAHKRSIADALAVLRRGDKAGRQWSEMAKGIEVEALRRLAENGNTLLHRYSVERYGLELVDVMQRELAKSVALGRTVDETAAAIAGTDRSVFTGRRHRAELIARMELNRAYNDAHDASIVEAAAADPFATKRGPLLRKIDEFRDQRNHPISVVLEGLAARPDQLFRVAHAEVLAAAAAIRKPAGGIVWEREGAHWVGFSLPAHFGERGRIVPWRMDWGPARLVEDPRGAAEKAEAAARAAEEPAGEPEEVDEFGAAAQAYQTARDSAASAGLDPDVWRFSPEVREGLADAAPAAFRQRFRDSLDEPMIRDRLEETVSGAVGMSQTGLALYADDIAAIADRARREIAALERVREAYAAQARKAGPAWLEGERRAFLDKVAPKWGEIPKHKAEELVDALATLDPVDLFDFRRNGERMVFVRRGNSFADQATGYGGKSTIAVHDVQFGPAAVHELTHRLDVRNSGNVGTPWQGPRAKAWAEGVGAPFDAAKSGGKITARTGSEVYESWAGNFVDSYEARIYESGGLGRRTVADGPIEFLARASEWRTADRMAWKRRIGGGPVVTRRYENAAGVVFEERIDGVAAASIQGRDEFLDRARETYGRRYVTAQEEIHGDGLRLARELAERPAKEWAGAWDVEAAAGMIHTRYGTPVDQLLGERGALRPLLPSGYKAPAARELSIATGEDLARFAKSRGADLETREGTDLIQARFSSVRIAARKKQAEEAARRRLEERARERAAAMAEALEDQEEVDDSWLTSLLAEPEGEP